MAIHRDNVEEFPGTLVDLANAVGDLRYDALAVFLRALASKLTTDASADLGRGRSRLAASLRGGALGLDTAATEIKRAWSISAPYM